MIEKHTTESMQYRRDRDGSPISVLGYGCMRFTGKAGRIDVDKTGREIMAAYEAGVNYFDTAYIYPGSEAALGQILEKNGIRDRVYIATKLPHYLIKNMEGLEKTFQEQLRRLRTDYVDFYLMHMLTDVKTWNRLIELGILDWLREKKDRGEIKRIGFSYHGNTETFCELLAAWDWDFCQIQYNYLDENSQAGRKGLMAAAEKGIPVVIMEPLRGGRLATKLPKEALSRIREYPVQKSPAAWSFGWLWDQPQVTCVLSGMNSLEMVEENCKSASESSPGSFTAEDYRLIEDVKRAINAGQRVGCTGCRYCMPCPKQVDIPGIFAAMNRKASDGALRGKMDYFICTGIRPEASAASNCVECGKCERHCPQHIEIRKELKAAEKELEGIPYRLGRLLIRLFRVRF